MLLRIALVLLMLPFSAFASVDSDLLKENLPGRYKVEYDGETIQFLIRSSGRSEQREAENLMQRRAADSV